MLKIGLPAGAEFALIAVYLFVVYTISRPFGAAAQAGFGIGLRIVQAGFMPVVALGFSVAPVAGQNFGARLPERVRKTYLTAAAYGRGRHGALGRRVPLWRRRRWCASSLPTRRSSTSARSTCASSRWTFVGSGLVFVSSSMFQALGNTVPPLAASVGRMLLTAVPAFYLAHVAGFQLRWIWYLSAWTIVFQVAAVLWLLKREFRLRLGPMVGATAQT